MRRISKLTKAELARREAERKKKREQFLWHIRSQGAAVSHRALHAFSPEKADYGETKNTAEDLLTFEAGALIEVTWSEDRFWWCGFVKGKEDKKGFFPADFVEPADTSQKSTPHPIRRTKSARATELRSAVSLPRTPALPVDLFSGGWWTSKEDWELTEQETQELAEYRTDISSDSDYDDELLNEGVPPPHYRPQNAALSPAGLKTGASSHKSPAQAGASWSEDNPFGDAFSSQPFQDLATPDAAPRHPHPELPAMDDATGDPSSVRGQMGLKTPEEKAEEEKRYALYRTTEHVAAVEEAGRAGPFANQVELTDPDLRGLADGEDVVQARARAEAHATTRNKKKQGRKASGCRGCWCGGKPASGAD